MRRKFSLFFAGLAVLALFAVPLYSQAVFSAGASPRIGADIGATELTGGLVFAVDNGTTAAGSITVRYSALITNNNASDIIVTPTWGTVNPAVLDRATNSIVIDVPAGGGIGNQILVAGIRVALAGYSYTNVTATITGMTGNSILAGQTTVTVISAVMKPFSVTLGNPISWRNGAAVNSSTQVLVSENFIGAFSSAIGFYGQTARSRLVFNPFPDLPEGVTVTFPATVTSTGTGAVFTTTSGAAEIIPRTEGTETITTINTVTYEYQGVPQSN